MEFLKNVLIKESAGHDYVFIVDNLPKDLLYQSVRKLVFVPRHAVDFDRTEPKQVEAYTLRDEDAPDEPRNRRLTHEMVDELLPGIEHSQTGDGGYVFYSFINDSKERLATIDRFIRNALGPVVHIPARVPYAAQKGSFTSGPMPLSQIPRVELPAPVSPPVNTVQDAQQPSISGPTDVAAAPAEKPKRNYTEAQRRAMSERLAAARAAKNASKSE